MIRQVHELLTNAGFIWRAVPRAALSLLFPPRCLSCAAGVAAAGMLCAPCWGRIRFLSAPHCAVCGHPFPAEQGPATCCGACLDRAPAYGRARAAIVYGPTSRRLILTFKHGDRTSLARPFAQWMVAAGHEILSEADLLVPVPLHRWRLFRRRYNQAALLAHAVSRLSGVACAPTLLARVRRTPPQGRMGRQGRRRNVQGAFRVADATRLQGKRVVLIDDVLTTGATIEECVRVLKSAGAGAVDVLTLARVVLA